MDAIPIDVIPEKVKQIILDANSMAIWPMDEYPLSKPYEIASYFQDKGFRLYPIHDLEERILEEQCYRDIRLIPDDYDILLLFTQPDQLPETVNAIFNSNYIPPVVWTHVGIEDLESFDRMNEAGMNIVMGKDLMKRYREWTGD
ncbi:MAG TPA: CoA-binding protein [bacterium]